jgi:preprotein translocase subunit SecY
MKRSPWRFLWKSSDIRRMLLYTVFFLIIYRLVATIPVPGVNRQAVKLMMSSQTGSTIFGLLDMLSGGTVSNFSILAMGVYPYITAQIIIQLIVPIIPSLQAKMKENQREGQKWMEKWTVILTVPMAFLSAVGQINIFTSIANQIQSNTSGAIGAIVPNYGWSGASLVPTLTTIFSMMAGTMFGIWIGQLISEYGIPNQGLSLIIFSGIIAKMPGNLLSILKDPSGNGWWQLLIILIILVLVIFAIVYVQQGRRNVKVLFPGRRMGNRMSMPVTSNLPLMVNMAGMIPLIFAQSFLTFPTIIASFFLSSKTAWVQSVAKWFYTTFSSGNAVYPILYFLFVVGFTYFYTDVMFTQQEYGENLKKQGAQVQGVTQGPPTQRYLHRIQQRITLPGALFLGFVAVLPYILQVALKLKTSSVFLISAAGLLIVVGVVRDTFTIIETELKLHGYEESLIKG